MTGSPPFLLENNEKFARTFRKLAKSKAYGKTLVDTITPILESLRYNPYPRQARDEPLPGKTSLPEEWTLHKLEIWLGKGASGQVRLIYRVNETERVIRPIWIYSHEQFKKRPPDKELADAIELGLELPES